MNPMNPILALAMAPVDAELTRLNALVVQLETPADQTFTPVMWVQPGNVGNSGGGSPAPHGTYILTPGDPMVVRVSPAEAFDNFYFFDRVGQFPNLTKFNWSGSFSFPTASDLAACQALEWQWQQCVNGAVWNGAWQISLKPSPPVLRYYEFNRDVWTAFAPFDASLLAPGKVLSVMSEHSIDPTHETHIAITLNGVRIPVSFTQANTPNKYPPSAVSLDVAFQLDANSKGTPYTVEIDKIAVICR
jgi:hypothetical protein